MERDHLLCRCRGITYGQIEDAVRNGADNYQKAFELLRFGVGCGGCRSRIKQMIMNLAYQFEQEKNYKAE